MSNPIPQKYARFENQNDVHCNVKPSFNTAEESEPPLSSNNMPYSAVNGHAADFVKTEDLANTSSTYNTSCEGLDRTISRASQQYSAAADFATPTFTSRGQPSEKSRAPEFTGTFKQENGFSPSNDTSTPNGLLVARPKSEDDFRLVTDIEGNNTSTSKEDDLKNQLCQFERVLQGIKSRDESCNDTELSNNIPKTLRPPQSQSVGNGLTDSPDIKINSNQLNFPNDSTTQLPKPRSTAQQVLQQFLMAQQHEKMASRARFDRNMLLNPQGVGEQNNPRLAATPRASSVPVRQRVYQQLQQRKSLQQMQQRKIAGATPQQLQARNPVLSPLVGNTAYQMHPKVRYSGITPNTQQGISSFTHPTGRIHQNLMQPLRQPASLQTQAQVPGQIANLPRHQINMLAQQQQQQQKLAFQQQMASRLPPSYSQAQAQHLARSSSVMDIRQKFSGGVPSTHASQYNSIHQQANRAQQPLSHLPHYNPPGYGNQSGPAARPVQVSYSGEYSGYQHPYQYGVNQDNKLHSTYQRHASLDDNHMVANKFHNPEIRSNFPFQRSSSLPGHAAAGNNIFNQTSPPVVRLGQNEPNLPDMNNNGNDHQDMAHAHPQAPLTHMKQHLGQQSSNLGIKQELYQGNNMSLAQNRPQSSNNLQTPLSNSFSNLLDMKSNSETSLFPFLGADLGGGTTDSSDFDSLLKSPDFDLLNMLEEPQKALQ